MHLKFILQSNYPYFGLISSQLQEYLTFYLFLNYHSFNTRPTTERILNLKPYQKNYRYQQDQWILRYLQQYHYKYTIVLCEYVEKM